MPREEISIDFITESHKGYDFSCIWSGAKVTGKIQVSHGNVYLCQNARSGASCPDKLGFKYSWVLGSVPVRTDIFLGIEKFCILYPDWNDEENT